MKILIIDYKKPLVLFLLALVMSAGFAMPATVSAADTATATQSGIPVGCPGNTASGAKDPNVTCPKLEQRQSDLHCSSSQTPTKLISGPKSGQWYCKDNSNQSGSGGSGSGSGSGSGGASSQPNGTFSTGDNTTHSGVCGSGSDAVETSINIGCKGQGNPITDMAFAIIRILSDGVGLVVIGSIIVGGIQYTASRGDPQSTAMAVNRIRSSVFALIIFIFGYAILNFIIPQGFFH